MGLREMMSEYLVECGGHTKASVVRMSDETLLRSYNIARDIFNDVPARFKADTYFDAVRPAPPAVKDMSLD